MSNLTLSITTIGDLLLNNRISHDHKGQPIENVNLTVPDYQRPYKWTARNSIQLLDDIIEARNLNKEVYRVGTLILHKDLSDSTVTYRIVDGQQRVITFSLLLYALYELDDENVRPQIPFLNQQLFNNPHNIHNLPNNLNAFRRRLNFCKGDSLEEQEKRHSMKKLRDFIESQCELLVVITDNLSEAFQFFDSQNARGKALYPHDLLKAYHLREMSDVDQNKTEEIVEKWEKISQYKLATFFGDYLYRLKQWVKGNKASTLNEHNIHLFKGITRNARTPFAQFYKSAFCYAQMVNSSSVPFVSGSREVNAFQLNTPIIAGKPFFDYTNHYYEILKDIQDNNKYEGFYIQDNQIVKTLDRYFSKGVGNNITRLLFDTALLLYVDKYCPATFPDKADIDLFEQFVVYAFIWAYSLRAQYYHLGWKSAQNYIMGEPKLINSINIYRLIDQSDSPVALLSSLADKIQPLSFKKISDKISLPATGLNNAEKIHSKDAADNVYHHYIHFFQTNSFLTD